MSSSRVAFKPRARLLQLLGDQLIGSSRLAVFELVKNAYDADATEVIVSLRGIDSDEPIIIVRDNGVGMTADIVKNVWFVPGHDQKKIQRQTGKRSPLGRLPLGEKGVGRFAAHKLGDRIELITRSRGKPEVVVEIDWSKLMRSEFLSDARVRIRERKAEVFKGKRTGTELRIGALREKNWTRGEVRRLYRQIVSICSPFDDGPKGFVARLEVVDHEHFLEGIPSIQEILKKAIWTFEFKFDGKLFHWTYSSTPPTPLGVEHRQQRNARNERLLLPLRYLNESAMARETVVADQDSIEGIGPISGRFYVFDRDRAVLGLVPESEVVSKFLNENGGVRVYRDGVRVYNYGERDDDWLGLDLRRVNTPTRKISRNIVVGAVSLHVDESQSLEEKTNREGFVENDAFRRLRALVMGALSILETERHIDKEAMRIAASDSHDIEAERIRKPIEKLREIAKKKKVDKEMAPYITRLEKDYDSMRESMLQAGISGLGLATVFHEVIHGVQSLQKNLSSGAPLTQVQDEAEELVRLLDGISALLRKGRKKSTSIKDLVLKAQTASLIRFRSHRVQMISPILEDEHLDFKVTVPGQLFVGVLTNILDNSFYWTRVRWTARSKDIKKSKRKIYIGRSDEFEEGPALVIADTGPGFQDDPEFLVQPFFTRRPEGMGLGLYYANMVMELCGGQLFFPDARDVDVPEDFDGAIIAMVFPEK